MDEFLKQLNLSSETQSTQAPPMYLVAGNDQTHKLQLASRLSDSERPASFDFINGITIIGSVKAQVLILGEIHAFIVSAPKLCPTPQKVVLIYNLSNITLMINQLKIWFVQFKQSQITVVISDYDSFKKHDPQTLLITFRLLRQLCASHGAQLFTVFDYQQMLNCVAGISNTLEENLVDEGNFKFQISKKEAFDQQQYDDLQKLFMKTVYVQQKPDAKIDLQGYYTRIEQKSKCGKDFDGLVE